MVRLRALGDAVFEVGDCRITPESDVLFALLLFIAIRSGQSISRDELTDLLWPGSEKAKSSHRLRQAIYQLKKIGAPIEALNEAVRLPSASVDIDFVGSISDPDMLATAASTGRLEILPRYAPTFSTRFTRWLESAKDDAYASLRRHLAIATEASRANCDHPNTIGLARACLVLDPFNVEATYALAESLALCNRLTEALVLLAAHFDDAGAKGRPSGRLTDLKRRLANAHVLAGRVVDQRRPKLVGRERLLSELAAWVSKHNNQPNAIALVGDAGLGKTRLIEEALQTAAVHGSRFVEYRASVTGDERPLVGALDILPALLSLPGAVGCAPESYGALTWIARGGPDRAAPPTHDADWTFSFATVRHALFDLLDAILGEVDLLVSVDDAHALDRASLELLLAASRRCPRLNLLLAARPIGGAFELLESGAAIAIRRVTPLSDQDSRQLLTSRLSHKSARELPRLVNWAVDLASGNPFFLTELATHLGHQHVSDSLPESLHSALDRKLGNLTPNARLLLQACAVLGQNTTHKRLEAMLGLPPHVTALSLTELESVGLITSRGAWVGCRHDLIADAAIRGLGSPAGSYLHRRCAVVLDREISDSPLESLAWDCAYHWHEADDHSRALELTLLIVDRLISLGLPQAAVDLCGRAERYCQTDAQEADRLLRLSRAHRMLYDWDAVIHTLDRRTVLLKGRAKSLDRYSDDELALLEARWYRDYDTRVLKKALTRAADQRGPTFQRLRMCVLALIVADNRQRPSDAHSVFANVESIEPATPRDEIEKCRARTVYHTSFGNVDDAIVAARRVIDAQRLMPNAMSLVQTLRWLSTPLKLANDVSGAIDALNESFRLASRLELRRQAWEVAVYGQELAVECEDIGLACDWKSIAHDLAHAVTIEGHRVSYANYLLARVAAMEGDFGRSRAILTIASERRDDNFSVRAAKSLIALDIFLKLHVETGPPPLGKVQRLFRLHRRLQYCGTNDFETGVLISALVRVGDRSTAQKTWSEYLHTRRTRLPMHSVLQLARAEVA